MIREFQENCPPCAASQYLRVFFDLAKRPVVPWVNEGWQTDLEKPRKWPDTEEKRRAAARKYGLREGDYKPLPADVGCGEYPDLGDINYDVKDPYENWSDVKYRRNFGEPVHHNYNMTTPDKFTFTYVEPHSPAQYGWLALKSSILMIGGLFVFGLLIIGPRYTKPVKPKQYPYDFDRAWPYSDPRNYPLTHYTFEPDPDFVQK